MTRNMTSKRTNALLETRLEAGAHRSSPVILDPLIKTSTTSVFKNADPAGSRRSFFLARL